MIRESYKDSRNMPPPHPVNNDASLNVISAIPGRYLRGKVQKVQNANCGATIIREERVVGYH